MTSAGEKAGTGSEVLLIVSGEETYADGHKDSTRTYSRAVYETGDGFRRFRYREEDPESRAVTESVIEFSSEGCSIVRTGAVNVKMRFVPDEETRCDYDTPFGSIPMEILTRLVAERQIGENFHARIRYRLILEGSDPVECVVTVRAEPAG